MAVRGFTQHSRKKAKSAPIVELRILRLPVSLGAHRKFIQPGPFRDYLLAKRTWDRPCATRIRCAY